MKSVLSCLLFLVCIEVNADARFDSLFAISNVVVVGRIIHQNSEPPVLETVGNRQYVNFKVDNVGIAGIPLSDSSAIRLAGDTLKRLSYLIGPGGESMWPYSVVLVLVRDTSDKNGWVLTNEVITQSSFNSVYAFFDRFKTYYTDAGFGHINRIELTTDGTWSIRREYYENGNLMREMKSHHVGNHSVTWETNYRINGKKYSRSRNREKDAKYCTKEIYLYTWMNGHPTLRRQVGKIID